MRIAVVLPAPPDRPSGGLRLAIRMAGLLAGTNHDVDLVIPRQLTLGSRVTHHLSARAWTIGVRRSLDENSMLLGGRARVRFVPELTHAKVGHDVVVAAGWAAAAALRASVSGRSNLVCLAADYEYWVTTPELRPAMQKAFVESDACVSISSAVSQMLVDAGVKPLGTIRLGVDRSIFYPRLSLEQRDPVTVVMPARSGPHRGTDVGIEALRLIKCANPDVQIQTFGDVEVDGLGGHLLNPSDDALADLLGRAAVVLYPSVAEGFGLIGAEAMASGACLVVADSGGVRDFVDVTNCAIVDERTPAALASSVQRAVRDVEYRHRLAYAGLATARLMTWDRCANDLAELLHAFPDGSV